MKREEAQELGLKEYNGTPCREYGHTRRWAINGACIACEKKWKEANREKINAQHRAYNSKRKENWTLEQIITFVYKQQQAQARFRKEGWGFNNENEWYAMWSEEQFAKRGKKKDEYAMTRIDESKAWSVDNCVVKSRGDQLRIAHSREHRNLFQTPNGQYNSLRAAALDYGITYHYMQQRRRQYPDKYYYVKEKK